MMKQFLLATQFFLGAFAYGLLEILWRGHTHISMLLLGGLCFQVLVFLSKSQAHLSIQCAGGAIFITAAEFTTGCIVNLWLGLDVWDYSLEFMHVNGQVCLRFTLLWYVLCAILLPCINALRQIEFHLPIEERLLHRK